jgi:RNA polymerase sigma-70 factor (ECF subfamily)
MGVEEQIAQLLASERRTEAFEDLLAAYQDKLFRLCYSMLGDRAQAEDAAQDAFLRIWKSLKSYRGNSALGTWIFAVTRNVCLTAISKRAALRTAPVDDVERGVPEGSYRELDIERMVQRLPENYRQVVMLFYMEERSYEEVARMLDLPMGTVKTYLHRARAQLATMVEEADTDVRRI